MKSPFFPSAVVALMTALLVGPYVSADDDTNAKLKASELGETRIVHSFGRTLLGGQPSPEDLATAKKRGIAVVISLRGDGEIDWDEKAVVEGLGLEFHHLGFQRPEMLTDDLLDKSLKLLSASDEEPVLMHCASANRVGAVWAAHRVLNDGLEVDTAIEEGRRVGLRTPGYVDMVRDYVKRKSAE